MKYFSAVFIALLMHQPAVASPILWEFVDATFFDGTAIEGTFVFDADTGLATDVQVSTSVGASITCATADCDPTVPNPFLPGPGLPGVTYSVAGPSIAPFSAFFGQDTGGAGFGGTQFLFVQFDGALTNQGGVVGIPEGLSVEFVCNLGDDGCTNTFDVQAVPFRSSAQGGFIRSVPEPASVALLLLGMLGLGVMRRRVS